MAESTGISWTDATWNTIIGCSKVSEGCNHCYAETWAMRYGHSVNPWAERFAEENVKFKPHKMNLPRTWKEPKRVFVNSLSDVFHPLVPFDYVDQMMKVMEETPQHTYQILTKRPERALEYFTKYYDCDHGGGYSGSCKNCEPLPNVWMGTSIENVRWAHRARILAAVPAAVRFISAEPLLGSVFHGMGADDRYWCYNGHVNRSALVEPEGPTTCLDCSDVVEPTSQPLDLTGIRWVIVGAESGKDRRRYDMAWAREIRDACVENGVGFFYKQSAAFRSGHHPYLTEKDGSCWKWEQYPGDMKAPTLAHDVTGCEDASKQQEVLAL